MLVLNKTLRQNVGILIVVFSFLALSFAASVESAQTKTNAKSTPTPVKKKTTPTPAKTTKAIAKPTPKKSPTPTKTAVTKQPTPKTTSTPTPKENSQQVIVSVASARVRSQPIVSSSEIRRAKLGTLYKVLEKKDDWYKVQLSSSPKVLTGWMADQVLNNYDAAKRDEIYSRIISRNYKDTGMSFGDASEVYEFLTKAQTEIKDPRLVVEAAFKRLLALRSALRAVPFDKNNQSPYREFLKAHSKEVVYSDPAGEWYVRSELFWNLHKKYSKTSVSEDIAWAGARNPLPGECEAYVNCELFLLRRTDGEYLNLYPNGKYADEALKNIKNLLTPITDDLTEKKNHTGPSDVSDRAEFNRLIAELRTIVSKLPFSEAEKQKTIQQLNQIAEAYR